MTLRVLWKIPRVRDFWPRYINDDLESMQVVVDGYIETITLRNDLVLVVNEEGVIRELERSFVLIFNGAQTVIRGTAFLVGVKDDCFCDVPKDVKGLEPKGFQQVGDELLPVYDLTF